MVKKLRLTEVGYMAKIKGEEATTKLLMPMMMMLMIVMAIIMIPAVWSFQI